jgi:hypothetical protein
MRSSSILAIFSPLNAREGALRKKEKVANTTEVVCMD